MGRKRRIFTLSLAVIALIVAIFEFIKGDEMFTASIRLFMGVTLLGWVYLVHRKEKKKG
ncbi:hypothetical protein NBT05_14145 [Aquimarina sp. ERC-38]|uniref:hypothetical protein n=1 Tax=Aquimarina sp. ERC-38 TaxID=2949996 RepID=UPI002247BF56|nr:hypothetical protein [Aquimarina sp. ERC-38]UZO80083.1 hypothetical protein NBT05_14145 [Aquimarina sp. ERC-38]